MLICWKRITASFTDSSSKLPYFSCCQPRRSEICFAFRSPPMIIFSARCFNWRYVIWRTCTIRTLRCRETLHSVVIPPDGLSNRHSSRSSTTHCVRAVIETNWERLYWHPVFQSRNGRLLFSLDYWWISAVLGGPRKRISDCLMCSGSSRESFLLAIRDR